MASSTRTTALASSTDSSADSTHVEDDAPEVQSADERTQELVRQLNEASTDAERQFICTQIIEATIPVADRLAARYRGRGIPLEDLRQVARAALVQAMRRFEGAGRESFLAYAIPCMRGELRRYFRDAGWVVRPPRRIQEARAEVSRTREELQHLLGHDPSVSDIAAATDLPIETVREASGAGHCFRPDSLDQPLGDGTGETAVAETVGAPEGGFEEAEARAIIRPLLDGLGERDRQLITLRFYSGLTQSEVGRRIGISQMQVSRVEARILREFRDTLVA